jgi:hypothetical protein
LEANFPVNLIPKMWIGSDFEFAKFEIKNCSNKSEHNQYLSWKPKCAPAEERDKFLVSEGSI